jgi:hypothetical protein
MREMTPLTIEPEQRTAAGVADFMNLFPLPTANFAEFPARGSLIAPSALETAKNPDDSGGFFGSAPSAIGSRSRVSSHCFWLSMLRLGLTTRIWLSEQPSGGWSNASFLRSSSSTDF